MRARGSVGAEAVAELDAAELEVLLEVSPFVWGDVTVLGGVALGAAAGDEFPVAADDVVGEDGGVAAGGLQVDVPEEGGGDVQREAGADHLGGEQAAEVVRGEGEGPAGVGDPRGVRGRDEDGPDVVVGQDFLVAGTVLRPLAPGTRRRPIDHAREHDVPPGNLL
jgi:hypothetical protein